MVIRSVNKYPMVLFLYVISGVMLLPFIVMLLTSFKTSVEINSPVFHFFPRNPTLSNYPEVFKTGNWSLWIFNSVYVTFVVTIISLIFNSMGGFALARLQFKGREVLFVILLTGVLIPPELLITPMFVIMKNFPLFGGNNIFGQGGTGIVDSYLGLIINRLSGAFGVFLCRQYFMNFPGALDDAAEIDGCSVFERYVRIYLPLSKPMLASLGILKMTSTWNDYIWPLIITSREDLRTVQLALAIFKNEYVRWDYLMAATAMISLPIFIIFIFGQRYFVQGIVTTGIKG